MFYYDYTYVLFMLPCIIISLICQVRVKTAFSKYSKIPNTRGMTGAQAAEYVLRQNPITSIRVQMLSAFPTRFTIRRLSPR